MNEIDNLTLEYLASDYQKEKMLNNSVIKNSNKLFVKDKKFYKIRILNLLKLSVANKSTDELNIPIDLEKNINLLFFQIIKHLKDGDKVDLIQSEFKVLGEKREIMEEYIEKNKEEIKNITNLYNIEKSKKTNNLDNFVKITKYKKEEYVDYPKKKIYKIKTNEYKIKGVHKKNNVNINYDEEK